MTVSLFCELHVRSECMDEFLPLIQQHAATCQADEDGCLIFRVGRDREDSSIVRIFEEYTNQDAVDHHNSTDRFRTLNEKIDPMLYGVTVSTVDQP